MTKSEIIILSNQYRNDINRQYVNKGLHCTIEYSIGKSGNYVGVKHNLETELYNIVKYNTPTEVLSALRTISNFIF